MLESESRQIIVGSGISGSYLSHLHPEALVLDKGRRPGGRLTSKTASHGGLYDLGATMFHDGESQLYDGRSFLKTLQKRQINLDNKPIYSPRHRYLPHGMGSLVSHLLSSHTLKQSHQVKEIRYETPFWILEVENSETKTLLEWKTKRLFLTIPVPQILNLLSGDHSFVQLWKDFLKTYDNYRKTLVSCFIWKNWSPPFQSLDSESEFLVNTRLIKGKDSEYQSWESFKYPVSGGSTLLIQWSESFSDRYFDDWMGVHKTPTEISFPFLEEVWSEEWKAPKPEEIILHRWKFAQHKNPMMSLESPFDWTKDSFQNWNQLSKETGLYPIGDWMFGSRIERLILGIEDMFEKGFLV